MSSDKMPIDGKLLLVNARNAVAGPLRFGDAAQIKAARFIEAAQEEYRHILGCSACQAGTICFLEWANMTNEKVWAAAWSMLNDQDIAEAALISGEAHL